MKKFSIGLLKRDIMKDLRKRRTQMVGHMWRHGGLLRDILESEVGKTRERPRL